MCRRSGLQTRAVANRSQEAVQRRIAQIEEVLPFAILGFDRDNGGEFLNWHLLRYFQQRPPAGWLHPLASLSQKRQRKKNWTHVRQLVGYGRTGRRRRGRAAQRAVCAGVGLVSQFLLPGHEAPAHRGGREPQTAGV